jgi:hypothetical protein
MAYTPENSDLWIDKTLSELKYRINDKNRSLHPTPWYTSGEALQKGHLVSLCDAEWETSGVDKVIGKVYKADSEFTDRCLGIALNNTAGADEPVEVLSWGIYEFENDVFLSTEVGKMAYVKVDPDGEFTTDRNEATLGGNKLIEVGTVVSTKELLISFEGDSRGPVGITEIEYTLGDGIVTNSANNPLLLCQAHEATLGKTIGKVYTADKRKTLKKFVIAGFIVGSSDPNFGTSTPIAGDSKVICQRQGLVGGFKGLQTGLPVYADTNGAITQNLATFNFYTDVLCPIGIAYSETSILVNIESSIYNIDSAPIGTIIPIPPNDIPDYGYLKCDGTTYDAITNPEYSDLFTVIGITFGGTGEAAFEVPDLVAVESVGFQIKYKAYYEALPADAPVFRIETDWAAYNSPANVDVNINAWGETFELDEAVVKIFIKNGSEMRLIEPSPQIYTEVNAGTTYFKYGYQAIKLVSDPDYLRVIFAPDGLAYLNDLGEWVPVDSSWQYKIVIYKAEKWNRFTDITAETKLNTLFEQALVTRNKTPTTKYSGEIDRGVVDPSNTTRLNYDGNLYVNLIRSSTNINAKGKEVILNDTGSTDASADTSGIRLKGVPGADKTILWKDGDDAWHLNQSLKLNTTDGVTNKFYVNHNKGDVASEGNLTLKGNLNFKRPLIRNLWARYSAETLGDYPSRATAALLEDSVINPFTGWTPSSCTFSGGTLTTSGANSQILKGVSISGAGNPYVKIKFRKITGTATTLTISSSGVVDTHAHTILPGDNWQVLSINMESPWNSGTVTAVTLSLNNSGAGDVIDIAYIYIGAKETSKTLPALIQDTQMSSSRSLVFSDVGPVTEYGFKEKSLRFDSSINSYLASSTGTRGFTNGDFSLHFSIRKNVIASQERIIDYGNASQGFYIQSNSAGRLVLVLKDSSSPVTRTSTDVFFTTSFDVIDIIFSRASNTLSIYKNSILFEQFTGITFPAGCTNQDGNFLNLYVGADYTGANRFGGLLEDIHIYSSSLSLEEIKALYYLDPSYPIWIREENWMRSSEEVLRANNLTLNRSLAIGTTNALTSGIQKTLKVVGSTELNGTLDVIGANKTTLQGNLEVDGTTQLDSTTTINAGLNVTGASSFTGNVSTSGATSFVLGNSSKVAAGFYTGTTAPTNTNRLNFDGYLYGTRVYGAVWNDIADFVEVDEDFKGKPGKVYFRTDKGLVREAAERAQRGCLGIYSDTYGLSAGGDSSKKQIPLAVGGWALAYVRGKVRVGDALVSGPEGYLVKATLWDRLFHSERILAIYDRVEKELTWPANHENSVVVDNRVWVKVR